MFSVLTVRAGYTLNIDTVPACNSSDILVKLVKTTKVAIIEMVTLNQKIKREN